ncbi:ASKHA domain-containing protein [Desulforhopalus sp. 52FAK]
MRVEIVVTTEKGLHRLETEEGLPVSNVLREFKLLQLPCGGTGSCGKCLIYANTTPAVEELKRLSGPSLANGLRLACYTLAYNGLTLSIPHQSKIKVLTTISTTSYDFVPLIEHKELLVEKRTLEDQSTDIQNILATSGAESHNLSLTQQAGLPAFLRGDTQKYALLQDKVLHGFSTSEHHTLLAVDIGTTTVAAMVMDLKTQEVIEVYGEQNKQASFGADVISRIHHTMSEGEDGIRGLQMAIVEQVNRMKDTLCRKLQAKGVDIDDPTMIAITGNSCMIHFLCALPAEYISKAPFVSVTLDSMQLHASELHIESNAPVVIMPGISAYVGADIVASLLAADAHKRKEPFLLVDFGTNAEIVLSDGEKLYACSTAAGPCFEGATLSCGTIAKPGAVDTIFRTEKGFDYTTIDGAQPVGICGSAVIDCLALLLRSGDLDETGRLEGEGELSEFVRRDGPQPVFLVAEDIFLSQEDVRKIQLAKAAVRAGIETLLKEAGIQAEQVENLFLAGGFGAALNPENAVRIGLVPEEMEGAVRVLGNGAGCGVMRYATEKDADRIVQDLKGRTEYLELSMHAGFTDEYVTQMTFPGLELKVEELF